MNPDKSRWPLVMGCLGFSALLLVCGWLVPAYLHAVDASVLRLAGQGRPSLVDCGVTLAHGGNPEAARLVLEAAQAEKIPGTETLAAVLPNPDGVRKLASATKLEMFEPVTSLFIQSAYREPILARLQASGSPAVAELLRVRELTNTVIFPPSASASGQAIDTAIAICGLLMTKGKLTPALQDVVVQRAASATTHPDAQPVEEILVDLMSLGQRLNFEQLGVFVGGINQPATLNLLAESARNAGSQLPELFAAVALSHQPDQVAGYLREFSKTGPGDLTASLVYGEGGLDELLKRRERLYAVAARPAWTESGLVGRLAGFGANCALRAPGIALILKWFFYISSGFLLAVAVRHLSLAPTGTGQPARKDYRGFYGVRECLFAAGFLVVVLMLSEPFLAQENQKAEFTFRLRLPMAVAAVPSPKAPVKTKLMDTRSLFTLALFFVLQGLIYTACRSKLAEIQRQKVPARVQLKLLENEEHLFDGGLYLGFAGTIVCLILVSLGVIQQSLMAAYSSTSFGIIFVSVFKIFNLRPVRRRLLIESEEQSLAPARPVNPPSPVPVA